MMKRLIILVYMLLPLMAVSQWKTNSRGYAYLMRHGHNFGGGILYDYGFNPYLAAGLGVELTGYNGNLMIPTFADLRVKYPVNKVEPFINGQFGYNNYRVTYQYHYTDGNNNAQVTNYQKTGKYFWGAGAGVSFLIGKVGVFASYTYRGYVYKFPKFMANDTEVSFPDDKPNVSVISGGIVF